MGAVPRAGSGDARARLGHGDGRTRARRRWDDDVVHYRRRGRRGAGNTRRPDRSVSAWSARAAADAARHRLRVCRRAPPAHAGGRGQEGRVAVAAQAQRPRHRRFRQPRPPAGLGRGDLRRPCSRLAPTRASGCQPSRTFSVSSPGWCGTRCSRPRPSTPDEPAGLRSVRPAPGGTVVLEASAGTGKTHASPLSRPATLPRASRGSTS